MKRSKLLLTVRDKEILQFIWRWKLPTTALIAVWFFSTNGRVAYNRLEGLRRAGYLEIVFLGHKNYTWTLTHLGFKTVQPSLGNYVDESFRAECPNHDAIVTAMHLGHWAKVPQGVDIFSEQELRSYHRDLYPSWVPQTEIHRPDGYWYVPIKEKMRLIALEVELSRKRDTDYERAALFYENQEKIARVVWVVPNLARAKAMNKLFEASGPKTFQMHDFVLLQDLHEKGWSAPIVCGQEYERPLSRLLENWLSKSPSNFTKLWNLDGRKCPYNLQASSLLVEAPECDRSAFPADPSKGFVPSSPSTATIEKEQIQNP